MSGSKSIRYALAFGLVLASGCTLVGQDFTIGDASAAGDAALDASEDARADGTVDASVVDGMAVDATADATPDASEPDAMADAEPCTPTDPPTEICDGIDNDCNPATEDGRSEIGFGTDCDGDDADFCDEGTFACVDGMFGCSDTTDDSDFRTDELNCGACGNRCAETELCGDSSCRVLPTSIGAGLAHSCALMSNRTVYCWGDNSAGQLGAAGVGDSTAPVLVAGLTQAVGLAVGKDHNCALLSDGSVSCWGRGSDGALGNGSTTNSTSPVRVMGLPMMATQVTSGQTNSCALLMDRSVYCWGQGTSGVLGDGTTTLRSTAGPVSGISDAVQVDLGLDSGCAVRAGGTVSCWGSNGAFRKLGTDSSVAFSAVPMEIPSMWISNAVAVQVGGNHACVRTRLRTLICWGESLDGRLGRTTLDAYGLPDRATDATEVAGLSTLSNFTCLTERGTGNIRCWGSGLGGGVTLSTVDAFPGQALEVSAGEAHACGLNDSQIVYCWGRNADGQLGNGATVATTMPATAVSFPL